MAMPRGRHEGNVFKRPARNYWEGSVSLGGRRYYVVGKTRQEVINKLRALSLRYETGALAPPSRLALGEWLLRWLSAGEARWRRSTLRRRRQVLAPLLALPVARVRLQRLSPLHVLTALEELRRAGMGARSLAMCWETLHAALEDAREMGLAADNPCARVPRPRHEGRERPTWGEEEARRFYDACLASGHPLGPLLAFLLCTGLRVGEALGLRWRDIGEDGAAVVREQVVWTGQEFCLGPPKTRAGVRAVPLPRAALRCLEALPPPRSPDEHVFWRERPPNPVAVSRAMTALCRRAGVPRLNCHSLRAVAASLLVAQGVEVRAVQALLGHSRASITLDIYSRHLSPQARQVAEAMDQALDPRESGP
jgi:integrase